MIITIRIVGILLLTVAIIWACGSQPKIGQERVVEKSGNKPDWVNQPSLEEKEELFFLGEMTGAKNRAFGMDQAHANGVRQVLNTMSNKAYTMTGQAAQGSNLSEGDVGVYSEFMVGWMSDNITFAGITAPESYWEKVEKTTDYGVDYFYNCYVRLRISRENYEKTIRDAFRAASKKAQDENNQAAEETVKKVLEKLEQLR